jgi:hypothetical protein
MKPRRQPVLIEFFITRSVSPRTPSPLRPSHPRAMPRTSVARVTVALSCGRRERVRRVHGRVRARRPHVRPCVRLASVCRCIAPRPRTTHVVRNTNTALDFCLVHSALSARGGSARTHDTCGSLLPSTVQHEQQHTSHRAVRNRAGAQRANKGHTESAVAPIEREPSDP